MITMNVNNFESSTTSSSVSDMIPTTPSILFDFEEESGLIEMEQLLRKNYYIKDDILSVDDVLLFDLLRLAKSMIIQKRYPNIFRWCKELECLKQNWRISKKKNKGNSFIEYIKQTEDRLREERTQIKENSQLNLLKEEFETKSESKNHNMYKKGKEYRMELAVYFRSGEGKHWNSIASNLSIICQAYLPRDTEIKPINDDNGEIYGNIITRTHKDNYDLSYIEQDIRRNISAVEALKIISIVLIEDNSVNTNSSKLSETLN